MERYTSEEALNGILNILETVVKENNRNQSKDETSDTIRQILQGAATAESAGLGVGQQVEQLANGLSMMKQNGVDDALMESVATGITQLSTALGTFAVNNDKRYKGVMSAVKMLQALGSVSPDIAQNISDLYSAIQKLSGGDGSSANIIQILDVFHALGSIDSKIISNIERLAEIDTTGITSLGEVIRALNLTENYEGTNKAIEVLSAFGKLDSDTISNIERLGDIDLSGLSNLAEVFKGLEFSRLDAITGTEGQKNIAALGNFVAQLDAILGKTSGNLTGFFSTFRAKRIGKSIGKFYSELVKAIPRDKVHIQIQGVGELLQALYPLIKEDSDVSVLRMKMVLTEKNGQQIGMFFKEVMAGLPTKNKQFGAALKNLSDFLKLITTFGLKDYIKLKTILTEKNGKQIGLFFSSIFNEIEGKKIPDLKPITEFLRVLSSIGVVGAVGLLALKPILTEKFGKQIAGFFNAVIKDITKDKMERISLFTKSMKTMSQGMLIMAATIGLLAAEIALFGTVTILESLAITTIFVAVSIGLMRSVGKATGDISKGTAALKDVAKAMTLLSINVVIIAATASMLQTVEWESLGKVGAVIVVLTGIAMGAMWLADKWNKGGDAALKTMAGLSVLLISTALTIGIVAYVAKTTSDADLTIGLIAIGLVIAGGYFIVDKLLQKNNKDFDKAINNLAMMIAIMAATALTLKFIVAPLADVAGQAALGGIVVIGAIALMTGIVWGLSKIKKENLDKATSTLWQILIMFAGISLLANYVLPKIAEKWDSILGGALVVTGIIALMTGITVALAMLSKKGLLRAGLKSLYGLTAMFTVLSIVAATLLVPIAENAGAVIGGALVVSGIIALMGVMAFALAKWGKNRKMETALITMGALVGMFVLVSIVALTLLVPISKNWKDVALGAAVVLGIIGAMEFMVIMLGKFGSNRKLTQAYVTMAVLTGILIAVSLIVDKLLIPIGYEWQEAAIGAAVVIGIMGVMVGLVALTGKIKKQKLVQAILTMAGLGVLLLGMSYITSEFIIPIGKQWKAAAKGGAVLAGTLAAMIGLVALAGKIDKKTVVKGTLVIGLIEALLWSMDKALKPYISLAKEMAKDWKNISKGGIILAATITAWGVLMGVIGALAQSVALYLASGAAAIAGIAGILWSLGEMMPSYIKLSKEMAKDWKPISKGGAIIAATITAWGLIMTGIGALIFGPQAALLAMGAAAITGIAAVLHGIGQFLPKYVKTAKLAVENAATMKKAGIIIPLIIGGVGAALAAIGVLYGNPLAMIAMGAGGAAILVISKAINQLWRVIVPLAKTMKVINDNKITMASLTKFRQLFLNKGGIADTIEDIVERMSDLSLWSSGKAEIIGKMIRPIFDTLATFINVIGQTLNMKYVTEWDKDGKPLKYETVTYRQMGNAGIMISKAFGTFLRELGSGMNALKDTTLFAMQMLSVSIGPIMSSVGTFANAIIKVMSQGIPDEWDKDGKPKHFTKLKMEDFQDAAVKISGAFGTFLETLGPHLEKLGPRAANVIAILGKGVKPVMDAVATFTDMVTGVVVGKEMKYTDSTGKEITKLVKVEPEKFKKAGTIVADAFKNFIETMWNAFKEGEYDEVVETHWYKADETKKSNRIVDIINALNNIGTVVDTVNNFIDVILKAHEQSKKVNLSAAGQNMAAILINFVARLQKSFATEKQQEIVQNITDCLGYVDDLIKASAKSYERIYNMFKNKKEKITVEQIQDMYALFAAFGDIETLKILKQINPRDISQLPGYLKSVQKSAKMLGKLPELMNNAEVTEAVTSFLKNIDGLTQKEVAEKADASKKAMRAFNRDLKQFTSTVQRSQRTIVKFTSSMKKATDSLRKFDDAIIKREQQRNEAMKKFANLVKEIADNIGSLQQSIETLDDNKIVSNFRGIASLFDMIKSINSREEDRMKNENASEDRRPAARENNRGGQNKTEVIPVAQNPFPQKMMVTMNFSNTSITGFMETTTM